MKIIKLLFSFSVILLLTGCTTEYNLHIDNNTIIEDVKILEDNANYKSNINDTLDEYLIGLNDSIQSSNSYDKEKILDSNQSGISFYNKFNYETFSYNSYFLSNCYPNNDIIVTKDKLSFSLKNNRCLNELKRKNDSITINIITDLEVINHNATQVNNNKYTWVLKYDSTEQIDFSLKREKLVVDNPKQEKNNDSYLFLYLIGGILVVISVVGVIIIKKNNDSNRV